MPVRAHDPDPKIAAYADPSKLVTTGWVADHLDDPDLVLVESERGRAASTRRGTSPSAVKVDWHTDLQDAVARDYVRRRRVRGADVGRHGHRTPEHDGGDLRRCKNNWWAAYALWAFETVRPPEKCPADGRRGAPSGRRRAVR